MANMPGLTAYTAPGAFFATDEELKAHYKCARPRPGPPRSCSRG